VGGDAGFRYVFRLSSKTRPFLLLAGAADLAGKFVFGYTELLPTDFKRWPIRRKAEVLTAIESGALGHEEARSRYQLSEEELLAWERDFYPHGRPGLRVTRVQQYRSPGSPRRGREPPR